MSAGPTALTEEQRVVYHRAVRFQHPHRLALRSALNLARTANTDAPDAGRWVGITGPSMIGKTGAVLEEVLRQVGPAHERGSTIRGRKGIIRTRIPVVWTEGSVGEHRGFITAKALFMGVGYGSGEAAWTVLDRVVQEMIVCQTAFDVTDDGHALHAGREASMLKFARGFISRAPSTVIVVVTEDAENRSRHFLSEPSPDPHMLTQLLKRRVHVDFAPIPFDRPGQQTWARMTRAAVSRLLLHTPVTREEATGIARETHDACQGLPGLFFQALALAATNAVGDQERLDASAVVGSLRVRNVHSHDVPNDDDVD